MLWTILIIVVVLWLLGFIGSVGGNLIHILLVIALNRTDRQPGSGAASRLARLA